MVCLPRRVRKQAIMTIQTSTTIQQGGHMDIDQTVGEIRMFAGDFAPKGWMFCHGQTLQISSNTALFSVLGRVFGGDGNTTFCLPDLRGRVPVGAKPGDANVSFGSHEGISPSIAF